MMLAWSLVSSIILTAGLAGALPLAPSQDTSVLQQAWSWLKESASRFGVSSRGELANYPNGGNKYETGQKGRAYWVVDDQKILMDYKHDKKTDTDWLGLGLELSYKNQSGSVEVLNNLQDGNSSFIWDVDLQLNEGNSPSSSSIPTPTPTGPTPAPTGPTPAPTSTSEPSTSASTSEPSTSASTSEPSTSASTSEPSTSASTSEPSTSASTSEPSTSASTSEPSTTV